jgi:lipopolysaccharide export system permease protein
MDYPIIKGYSFLIPNPIEKFGLLLGILFPIGIPLYLIAMYQRKLLLHDIRVAEKVSFELNEMIKQYFPQNL